MRGSPTSRAEGSELGDWGTTKGGLVSGRGSPPRLCGVPCVSCPSPSLLRLPKHPDPIPWLRSGHPGAVASLGTTNREP